MGTYPGCTVLVYLFFPNGYGFFELIHKIFTGGKSLFAMGRANGGQNRNFSCGTSSKAVVKQHVCHIRPLFHNLIADLLKFRKSHSAVGLEFQRHNRLLLAPATNNPGETNPCSGIGQMSGHLHEFWLQWSGYQSKIEHGSKKHHLPQINIYPFIL